MGEVYRGRDQRLQREVAIKILPEEAMSPDRQRRFTQEAVAASALNHPNIVTVYDVGAEGEIPYLVSELIDGVSLRTEMNRGRTPLKRLLDIASQIADGLAAAHDAGIVHRDLKPENVMITREGRVKIVDFGLAKTDGEVGAPAQHATLTQTAAGLIVGTVPYMSPEQASGGPADFRSDQFALGVIIYEMASATHPFLRDTPVQTLSAIIEHEPPDLAQLNPTLPIPVRWLVQRLLAKDPRDRFASTADIRAELKTIRDHLSELTTFAILPAGRMGVGREWKLAAAGAVLAAGFFALGRTQVPSAATFDSFSPLATDAGYQGAPAWSPDGKSIAYVAEVNGVLQVFTRLVGSPMRTQVTSLPTDCHGPYWSPDGARIYFHSLARNWESLWYVSPAGGSPQLMVEGVRHSAISPDGRTLFLIRRESAETISMQLWTSSPPGSEPKRYTRGEIGKRLSDAVLGFSPDGSKLLLWVWGQSASGEDTGFWLIDMPDGEPRSVLSSLAGPRAPPLFSWLPDNRHVVVTRSHGPTPGNHLWLADIAADTLQPLTATTGNEGSPGVSPDGSRVAFTSEANDFDLIEVPRDGAAIRTFLSSTRNEFDPAASPTSTQYAFVTDRTGRHEIWLRNQEGYQQQPIVTDADFGGEPTIALGSLAFSPDGRRLAYQRFAKGGYRMWISSVTGGTPVPLSDERRYQDSPTWSPDGNSIAWTVGSVSRSDGAEPSSWSLVNGRVGSGNTAWRVLARDVVPFTRPQWSPDGRWILCETFDGLMIIANDGSQSKAIASNGWIAYAWDADGRTIFGLRPTDDLHHFMLVSVDVQTERERVLNPNLGPIPQANQPIRGFSRLPNGGFLTSIARVRSDIYLIEGFRANRPWWAGLWPFARSRPF
jgi:Tol biopolymer transport system component